MQIGKRTLELSTPDDLDERLIELTGCSAKEMRGLLDSYCPPDIVAAALLPMVKDPPSRLELAETISKAGADEARAEVRAVYDRVLKKGGSSAKKEG